MDMGAPLSSNWASLSDLIVRQFETMPRQLQTAARFVLDHPKDAALISVREQARRAGVSHTTMVRLAVWLGLDNFEDLRALCLQALQDSDVTDLNLPSRAGRPPVHHKAGVVTHTAMRFSAHFDQLRQQASTAQFVTAASVFEGAKTVFSLGLRAEQAVAQRFAYLRTLMGQPTTLLEAGGTSGIDALQQADCRDVLLVVGMAPYVRATVELAQLAIRQGVTVVAITDSRLSPLAMRARETILVPGNAQFPMPSIVPVVVAAELLAVMIADRQGNVGKLLRNAEEYLATCGVFWKG